jgi:hypothetical protein
MWRCVDFGGRLKLLLRIIRATNLLVYFIILWDRLSRPMKCEMRGSAGVGGRRRRNAREVLRSIQRAKIDVNMRLAIVAAAMAPDAI